MTLAPDRPDTLAERAAKLRLIDTDIHNDLPSYDELRPFLASEWHPWLDERRPRLRRPLLRQHGLRPHGRRRSARRTASAPATPTGSSSS